MRMTIFKFLSEPGMTLKIALSLQKDCAVVPAELLS